MLIIEIENDWLFCGRRA